MKRLFFVILMACVTLDGLFANPATLALFRYDETKMNPGTVYTYDFINFKGEKRSRFYYYINRNGSVEKLSIHVDGHITTSDMMLDTTYFVFDNFSYKNAFAYMRLPNQQTHGWAKWDYTRKRNVLETFAVGNRNDDTKKVWTTNAQFLPCYDLDHWHVDFALAMRHYIGRKNDRFDIGTMYGGNFSANTVFLEKEEVINGVLCEKWIIQGKGALAVLFGVKQEVWFAKDDPFYRMVQYRNYMKLTQRHLLLTAVETKTEAEWQAFMAEQTEAMRVKMGYPKE